MHCDEENNTAKIIIANAINSMELLHFFSHFRQDLIVDTLWRHAHDLYVKVQ